MKYVFYLVYVLYGDHAQWANKYDQWLQWQTVPYVSLEECENVAAMYQRKYPRHRLEYTCWKVPITPTWRLENTHRG